MQFDSMTAALAMDGHGGYVWFVYATAVLVVAWLLLAPVIRARRTMARTRARLRRESRQSKVPTTEELSDAPGS